VKYAFMTFSVPEASLEQALALAKTHGYAGIEPRAEAKHGHGVELAAPKGARQEMRKKTKAAGIAIACVATSCTYADPATAAENTRKTHEYIDLAGDLGAPTIRVFGGQIGGGWSRERAIDEVAKSLSSVADHARERGVVVGLGAGEAGDHATLQTRTPSPSARVTKRQPVRRPVFATTADMLDRSLPTTKNESPTDIARHGYLALRVDVGAGMPLSILKAGSALTSAPPPRPAPEQPGV